LDLDGTGMLRDSDYNLIRLYRAFTNSTTGITDSEEIDYYLKDYANVFLDSGATRTDSSDLLTYLDGFVNSLFDIDQNNVINDFDYNLIKLYQAFTNSTTGITDSEEIDYYLSEYKSVFVDSPSVASLNANDIIHRMESLI